MWRLLSRRKSFFCSGCRRRRVGRIHCADIKVGVRLIHLFIFRFPFRCWRRFNCIFCLSLALVSSWTRCRGKYSGVQSRISFRRDLGWRFYFGCDSKEKISLKFGNADWDWELGLTGLAEMRGADVNPRIERIIYQLRVHWMLSELLLGSWREINCEKGNLLVKLSSWLWIGNLHYLVQCTCCNFVEVPSGQIRLYQVRQSWACQLAECHWTARRWWSMMVGWLDARLHVDSKVSLGWWLVSRTGSMVSKFGASSSWHAAQQGSWKAFHGLFGRQDEFVSVYAFQQLYNHINYQ